MKEVILEIRVIVEDTVSEQLVAQDIGYALDPSSWNWDVSYPVIAGVNETEYLGEE